MDAQWYVMFVAVIVAIGFGTGLWLHYRLNHKHQLSFRFRSPFRSMPTHIEWIPQEGHSHA